MQRLANDLRSENGLFEIEYDRYPVSNDARTGHDFYHEPRYYFMPDHGLFVAGIIRDIAPRARIRLVRILNDYGCCDLYNLFAALTDLEQELVAGSIRRLMINLSLAIMPDIRRLPYIWFENRTWPSTQLGGVTRLLTSLKRACACFLRACMPTARWSSRRLAMTRLTRTNRANNPGRHARPHATAQH